MRPASHADAAPTAYHEAAARRTPGAIAPPPRADRRGRAHECRARGGAPSANQPPAALDPDAVAREQVRVGRERRGRSRRPGVRALGLKAPSTTASSEEGEERDRGAHRRSGQRGQRPRPAKRARGGLRTPGSLALGHQHRLPAAAGGPTSSSLAGPLAVDDPRSLPASRSKASRASAGRPRASAKGEGGSRSSRARRAGAVGPEAQPQRRLVLPAPLGFVGRRSSSAGDSRRPAPCAAERERRLPVDRTPPSSHPRAETAIASSAQTTAGPPGSDRSSRGHEVAERLQPAPDPVEQPAERPLHARAPELALGDDLARVRARVRGGRARPLRGEPSSRSRSSSPDRRAERAATSAGAPSTESTARSRSSAAGRRPRAPRARAARRRSRPPPRPVAGTPSTMRSAAAAATRRSQAAGPRSGDSGGQRCGVGAASRPAGAAAARARAHVRARRAAGGRLPARRRRQNAPARAARA